MSKLSLKKGLRLLTMAFLIMSGFLVTSKVHAAPPPTVLTVSGITAISKTYNGNSVATLDTSVAVLVGVNPIDGLNVQLDSSFVVGAFSDKHVGVGKTVTVSGLTLTGTDAGNYSLSQPVATADISALSITVTAITNTKIYDGTVGAVAVPTITVGTLQGTDTASFIEAYATKTAVSGKTLIPSGTVTDGNGGANYNVTFINDLSGVITPVALTGTITASNKAYDRLTSATITGRTLIGVLAADTLTVTATGGTATFSDKNVAVGKIVSATGITLTGADATNYTYNGLAAGTANITAIPLTISASASNKVYDTNTTATSVLSHNALAGDVIIVTNTGATFSNKNVGVGKTVTTTFTLGGADLGNYVPTTSPVTTTANITPAPLTLTAVYKLKGFFEGNISAPGVTPIVTGILGTDTVTGLTETYDNSIVGKGKTLSVATYTINDGNGGANYSVTKITNTTGVIVALGSNDVSPQSGGIQSATAIISPPTPTPATVATLPTPVTKVNLTPAVPTTIANMPSETIATSIKATGKVASAKSFHFTLSTKKGSKGAEVVELQKYLNKAGYYAGNYDGIFGSVLKSATIKYQTANKLKPDGIIGPLVRALLNA